jgi:hypothetical protein
LQELQIKYKLLAVTSNSTTNNNTFIASLYSILLQEFDNKIDRDFDNIKEIMCFCRVLSYIQYLVYILNRIAKDILVVVKSGTAKEARIFISTEKVQFEAGEPAIVKIQLFALWVSRSNQCCCNWEKLLPKTIQPDVDSRWNSVYNIIGDSICCKK